MADLHLRQTIELFVDQQVFMDVVHGHEQVEEFSALTEVTSFEQRGENLYLEGNILFTAYLKQPAADAPEEGDVAAVVEHIQHRMPFDVTVPVDAQIAGMLSVAVTVPDTTVDILGPGWIHIRALVQVEGLSPEGGYTAHCGAQEAVIPAMPELPNSGEQDEVVVSQSAWDAYAKEVDASEPSGADLDLPASVKDADTAVPSATPLAFDDLLQPLVQSRDAAPEAPFSPSKHLAPSTASAPSEPESSLSEGGWKKQLEGADRALFGSFSPYRTGRAQEDERSSEKSSAAKNDVPQQVERQADEAPTHHFHFEAVDLDAKPTSPSTSAHVEELKAEFESARSEWHDAVLQPAQEPVMPIPLSPPPAKPVFDVSLNVDVQNVHVQHEDVSLPPASVTPTDTAKTGEVTMSYSAVPDPENKTWTAAQWFWNTLNIPAGENAYTMRFRIVQEAETLDDIAAHYATSPTELLRANPLAQAGLESGALLYIPAR